MSFAREAGRAIRSTLVLWVITALIYPFAMIAVGQILFPWQANGSLITNNQGQVVGSALIGQPFTSVKENPIPIRKKHSRGRFPD